MPNLVVLHRQGDGTDITLLRIDVTPSFWGPKRELRIDPHPAWDRT